MLGVDGFWISNLKCVCQTNHGHILNLFKSANDFAEAKLVQHIGYTTSIFPYQML